MSRSCFKAEVRASSENCISIMASSVHGCVVLTHSNSRVFTFTCRPPPSLPLTHLTPWPLQPYPHHHFNKPSTVVCLTDMFCVHESSCASSRSETLVMRVPPCSCHHTFCLFLKGAHLNAWSTLCLLCERWAVEDIFLFVLTDVFFFFFSPTELRKNKGGKIKRRHWQSSFLFPRSHSTKHQIRL